MSNDQHRNLIVTGGSRGIGAATAMLAGASGWKVCVNYQANEAAASSVVQRITDSGGEAIAVKGDVSRESDVLAMFDTCESTFGPVGGLVNNAGIIGAASKLADVDTQTLRDVVDINMFGALLCAREAARRVVDGGTIVNVSSAASTLGSPNEFIWYAATKGGMDSMTIGLAKEIGPRGVRVNAVNPGLIRTDIHDSSGIENRLEKLVGGVPLGRPGEPDEIAEAIVWLLSDAASYVSGAILRLGGGR